MQTVFEMGVDGKIAVGIVIPNASTEMSVAAMQAISCGCRRGDVSWCGQLQATAAKESIAGLIVGRCKSKTSHRKIDVLVCA